ncbi:MAG: PD-(D/E)XK nuclease family protein [Gammaproteobacteria bacterium]|nr:PD-(D/E)XK nuclease family protein [Gammaproteobacteria bacterium]
MRSNALGWRASGSSTTSAFRSITQVLGLALKQVWKPLSPRSLLQFLQHPVSPIPRRLRGKLAEIVAAQPGIGSKAWNAFVAGLETDEQALVRDWLEQPRFDPADGAPIDMIMQRARAIAAWVARTIAGVDQEGQRRLYGAALAQSQALVAALDRIGAQGRLLIGRGELERIVDEILSLSGDPSTFAQAGHVTGVAHPSEVEPADEILWWDLRGSADLHTGPFSAAERDCLALAGAILPSPEQMVVWHREDFLRVVASARTRLVLVVHEREGGRHLLESLIEARLDGVASLQLESVMLDGEARLPGLDVLTVALPPRELPAVSARWQLPMASVVRARERESYSSLEKLFNHPHIWVLDYAAKLRAGRLAELPDGPLLYGNLAHGLFERFFEERTDWSTLADDEIAAWLDDAVPSLISQSGAVLAELGRGVDHQRVVTTLERALPALVAQLKAARVVTVRCEVAMAAPLVDDVELRGDIDLWVARADGATAVIDIKWGSEERRVELLASNAHLQLATYAYLVAHTTGSPWPEPAYFIVATANLLARTDAFFPDATVVDARSLEDERALWRRALASYRWRRSQLERGSIDVLVAGSEDDTREPPPDDALSVSEEPDRFDPYATLTGWRVVQ